jgi:hypothetical protein
MLAATPQRLQSGNNCCAWGDEYNDMKRTACPERVN